MSHVWAAGIARALAARPLVVVGLGTADAAALLQAGADVRAVVAVRAAGGQAVDEVGAPTLEVQAADHDGWSLQAGTVGLTLEGRSDEISAFLRQHDRGREAAAVGSLTAPPSALDGREAWLPSSALARGLEAKAAVGAPLGDVLPWVPGEAAPALVDAAWWRSTTERLGVDRLVIQRVGLSAGGEGTWICDDLAEVQRAIGGCPEGARASPWIDGEPVNVTGIVGATGEVLVLPPSRQIVATGSGRSLYVGNMVGGVHGEGLEDLVTAADAAGTELAARGYVGMFGLDAIAGPDGAWFHDLNARLNGAIWAMDLRHPALLGALLFPGWGCAAAVPAAAAELRQALDARPSARWILCAPPGVTPRPVRPGLYRIDPSGPSVSWLGPPDPHAARGDLAVVQLRPVLSQHVHPGDRVGLADLRCDATLSVALLDAHGGAAVHRIREALEGGPLR